MPDTTVAPVIAPTITPSPDGDTWPDRFSDPFRICPQQKREFASPDVAP